MKYRIGQRIKNGWNGDEEPDCEIVCLGIFGDGTWKYGVLEDMAEYSNMIDFYTEEDLEKEFIIGDKNES